MTSQKTKHLSDEEVERNQERSIKYVIDSLTQVHAKWEKNRRIDVVN